MRPSPPDRIENPPASLSPMVEVAIHSLAKFGCPARMRQGPRGRGGRSACLTLQKPPWQSPSCNTKRNLVQTKFAHLRAARFAGQAPRAAVLPHEQRPKPPLGFVGVVS